MRCLLIGFFLLTFVLAFSAPTSYLLGPERFLTGIPATWKVIDRSDFDTTWNWWSTYQLARVSSVPAEFQNDWLLTPPFPGEMQADSIVLKYWNQMYHYAFEAGTTYVLLSVDGGNTWPETLVTKLPLTTSTLEADSIRIRIDNRVTDLTGNCKVAFKYSYRNSTCCTCFQSCDILSSGLPDDRLCISRDRSCV